MSPFWLRPEFRMIDEKNDPGLSANVWEASPGKRSKRSVAPRYNNKFLRGEGRALPTRFSNPRRFGFVAIRVVVIE